MRSYLRAVLSALDIPKPASDADERGYLRCRSARADEVVRAARNILESPSDPTGRNWAWAGARLRTSASDHSTAGYDHAGPGAGMLA